MPQWYTLTPELRLKQSLEEKLGWGQSRQWATKDFQNLSEYIEESTGVLLSVSTLKRFFGTVKSDTKASVSTLDTLSQFLGYSSWRVFFENATFSKKTTRPPLLSALFQNSKGFIPYGKILLLLCVLTGVGLISGFFVQSNEENPFPDNIPFEIEKVSYGLPNTVIFRYDLSNLKYDQIQIQQWWDKSKRVEVEKESNEASILYHYPGYFRAKLVLDGHIVQERDLYIATNDWLAAIEYPNQPRYLLEEDFEQEGILKAAPYIMEEVVEKASFDWMSFFYLEEFKDLNTSDFKLKTSFRNSLRHGNNVCQKTKLRLVGTEGAISIHFSIPGCVAENRIYLNGKFANGKDNDLSFLGCDFSDFIPLEVEKEGTQIIIKREGEKVYTNNLVNDIGKIAGISFHFKGAGEVEYVLLESDDHILVEHNFPQHTIE